MTPDHYIIISYKHSDGDNLTFWRKNNAGYTTDLNGAGRYSEDVVNADWGYYNRTENGEIMNYAIRESELMNRGNFRSALIIENSHQMKERFTKEVIEREQGP